MKTRKYHEDAVLIVEYIESKNGLKVFITDKKTNTTKIVMFANAKTINDLINN